MKTAIIVLLAVVVAALAYVSMSCSRLDAVDRIYRECNSFKMYEDGSYVCKHQEGYETKGCTKEGLCND